MDRFVLRRIRFAGRLALKPRIVHFDALHMSRFRAAKAKNIASHFLVVTFCSGLAAELLWDASRFNIELSFDICCTYVFT